MDAKQNLAERRRLLDEAAALTQQMAGVDAVIIGAQNYRGELSSRQAALYRKIDALDCGYREAQGFAA